VFPPVIIAQAGDQHPASATAWCVDKFIVFDENPDMGISMTASIEKDQIT